MRFRKYILTVLLAMSAVVPGKAQLPTIDIAAIAQALDHFIEQKYMHAENIYVLGEQLSTALQNLDQAKENIRLVRKTFSVAGQFFDDANVLVDLYDNMELLKLDYQRLRNQVTYYQNGGKISPARVYMTYKVVDQVSGRMYDTFKFTKDQILNSENHLTLHERMQLLDKVNREFRSYHSLLGTLASVVDEEAALADMKSGAQITTTALLHRPSEPKLSVNDRAVYTKTIAELKDPRSVSPSSSSDINKDPTLRQGLMARVFNIVTYIITILAILFFGWNFGVYNHGDRQRSDVLWKVGAGYMMMMVMLQVAKTVLIYIVGR